MNKNLSAPFANGEDSSLPNAAGVAANDARPSCQPDDELAIFVQGEPAKVRRVQLRIVSRSVATPNPIVDTLEQ